MAAGDTPQGLDVVEHARRGLAVGGQHGLERPPLAQHAVDFIRVHGLSPLHFDGQDVQSERFAQFDPPSAELSADNRQHPVAWRQQIDDRRLHGPAAGRREDEHVVFGLKNVLQARSDLSQQVAEFAGTVGEDRLRHLPDDAVGNRRGSGGEVGNLHGISVSARSVCCVRPARGQREVSARSTRGDCSGRTWPARGQRELSLRAHAVRARSMRSGHPGHRESIRTLRPRGRTGPVPGPSARRH